MAEIDHEQAAIDAAAENVTAFMLKWGWLDYLGSEEKIRSVCRAVATDAISGAAPYLAPHGDPLPARDAHHYVRIVCGNCTEEFGTNCDDHDITCPECEAQRCPCCGCWFGAEGVSGDDD